MNEILEKGTLQAIETDAFDGHSETRDVQYTISKWNTQYAKPNEYVFRILNGITGYESFTFTLDDGTFPWKDNRPYVACMGTSKRWNKLVIHATEMKKIKFNGEKP